MKRSVREIGKTIKEDHLLLVDMGKWIAVDAQIDSNYYMMKMFRKALKKLSKDIRTTMMKAAREEFMNRRKRK